MIEETPIVIETIVQMRPAGEVHFSRQEQRLIAISLPRVKWMERAEIQ